MPVEIRVSTVKNRLFLRMDGFMTDEEVAVASAQVIEAIHKLKPGFDAITDITTFKPSSPKAVEEIKRTQQVYKSHGVRRLIRVVGANVLAKMQLQRTSGEIGLEAQYVATVEEAERLLDK